MPMHSFPSREGGGGVNAIIESCHAWVVGATGGECAMHCLTVCVPVYVHAA